MTLASKTIDIKQRLLIKNDEAAELNRNAFQAQQVLAINLIAAPGAGKTSFINETIKGLKTKANVAVIEGDIAGSIDTEKVLAAGASDAVQINTSGKCHLEANMLSVSLEQLDLNNADFVLIENVGNLICPTSWDLGEQLKVCLVSAAEGDDKPVKYPEVFAKSDVIILNKIDLIPFVEFNKSFFYKTLKALNPTAPMFEVSCRTHEGVEAWLSYLQQTHSSQFQEHDLRV